MVLPVLMKTIVVPGRFTSLADIGEFVAQAAELSGLDDNAVYAVQLAVDEACTNIIEHAYGGEGLGDIECTCKTLKDGIEITLRDNGDSFDPKSVPDPDFNVPLEEVELCGAGLLLIRKLMDDIQYKASPKDGNVLILVKKK